MKLKLKPTMPQMTAAPTALSVTTMTSFDSLPSTGYMRQSQLIPAVVPFSSATLWRKVKLGQFPQPIKLSERVTAFSVGAVRQWLEEQAAGGTAK